MANSQHYIQAAFTGRGWGSNTPFKQHCKSRDLKIKHFHLKKGEICIENKRAASVFEEDYFYDKLSEGSLGLDSVISKVEEHYNPHLLKLQRDSLNGTLVGPVYEELLGLIAFISLRTSVSLKSSDVLKAAYLSDERVTAVSKKEGLPKSVALENLSKNLNIGDEPFLGTKWENLPNDIKKVTAMLGRFSKLTPIDLGGNCILPDYVISAGHTTGRNPMLVPYYFYYCMTNPSLPEEPDWVFLPLTSQGGILLNNSDFAIDHFKENHVCSLGWAKEAVSSLDFNEKLYPKLKNSLSVLYNAFLNPLKYPQSSLHNKNPEESLLLGLG